MPTPQLRATKWWRTHSKLSFRTQAVKETESIHIGKNGSQCTNTSLRYTIPSVQAGCNNPPGGFLELPLLVLASPRDLRRWCIWSMIVSTKGKKSTIVNFWPMLCAAWLNRCWRINWHGAGIYARSYSCEQSVTSKIYHCCFRLSSFETESAKSLKRLVISGGGLISVLIRVKSVCSNANMA